MIQLHQDTVDWEVHPHPIVESLGLVSSKGRVPIVKIQEDQFTLPKTNMTMENRQSENKQNV